MDLYWKVKPIFKAYSKNTYSRTGFEFWSSSFPSCGGSAQSPINIDRSLALEVDLPPLRFSYYDLVTEENTKLINNGRSLELDLQVNNNHYYN
jgi:carbonic anhydrase